MASILLTVAAHRPTIPTLLRHTGQHYDREIHGELFEDVQLPHPYTNQEVGSGSHAIQISEVMPQIVPIDSGCLQEEMTAFGIPYLTMRRNIERPITVVQSSNTMVGRDAAAIFQRATDTLAGKDKSGSVPKLRDGRAADLASWLLDGHMAAIG